MQTGQITPGHKRVLRSGFSTPFKGKSIRFRIRCPNHSRKHKKNSLWSSNSAKTSVFTELWGGWAVLDRDIRTPHIPLTTTCLLSPVHSAHFPITVCRSPRAHPQITASLHANTPGATSICSHNNPAPASPRSRLRISIRHCAIFFLLAQNYGSRRRKRPVGSYSVHPPSAKTVLVPAAYLLFLRSNFTYCTICAVPSYDPCVRSRALNFQALGCVKSQPRC